jgi:hypothetical protein
MKRVWILILLAFFGTHGFAHTKDKKVVEPKKSQEQAEIDEKAQMLALEKVEDTSKNPLGCRDVGYAYDLDTLQILPHSVGDKQSLYFFYNNLSQPVKLYHMVGDNTGHATFLNHTIRPKQWAALATGEPKVKYMCAIKAEGSNLGNMVSCKDSIKVCEFARTRFGLNNKGNFWIVQGNTRAGAVSEVVHYGIIPQ